MAIGADRVQVLKQEWSNLGGNASEEIPFPCPIEPKEDAIECAGVFLQDETDRDENVFIGRNAGEIIFKDSQHEHPVMLVDLSGISRGNEPNGFLNRSTSVLSWDNSTRTLSIAVQSPATQYTIWEGAGHRHDITTTKSVQIPNETGIHWFIFSNGSLITQRSGPSTFSECLVACLFWTGTKAIGPFDERHGVVMDAQTHEYLHRTIGTRYEFGLALSRVTSGSGTANGDAQIQITSGAIWDEDIRVMITHAASPNAMFEQDLGAGSSPAKIPVLYRTGTGSSNWTVDTATNYPVKKDATGLLTYNTLVNGSWVESVLQLNEYFVCVFIIGTANISAPIMAVMGQIASGTLQDVLDFTWGNMNFGDLPTPEIKILYKLVYRTRNTYANDLKCYVHTVTDMRNSVAIPATNYVMVDHTSFGKRSDPNAHPATSISTETKDFGVALSSTHTDVQLALDALDDHTHTGVQRVAYGVETSKNIQSNWTTITSAALSKVTGTDLYARADVSVKNTTATATTLTLDLTDGTTHHYAITTVPSSSFQSISTSGQFTGLGAGNTTITLKGQAASSDCSIDHTNDSTRATLRLDEVRP